MEKLTIDQVREWLDHPVSKAIQDNYTKRLNLMKKLCLQGQHICNETGQVKATYSMDVGHALSLEMFLNIWEDPHSFMEGVNMEDDSDET